MLALAVLGAGAQEAWAQVDPTPPRRQVRTYIPPDQLVTFAAETPFNQFVEFINPLFQRITGKSVVDLTERTAPIGVNVSGLQFLDAFELVLQQAGLTYRESDRYFLVEQARVREPVVTVDAAGAATVAAAPGVSSEEREIRIDAIIFEANTDRLRELGTNWGAVFGEQAGGGGGTTQGGGGGEDDETQLRLFLNASSFFESIEEVIVGPNRVDFRDLGRIFGLLEARGVGETVSSPTIVVRSGEEGRIQSGSDIPVTLQDFAGNTVTQYIPTGVIVQVSPVLVSEEAPGEEPIEFIHLVVDVEKSSGRLGSTGIIIDKNEAQTDVFLLDGEQTVIGGLYSTEESVARRGIPLLMDIPVLKYLFSFEQRSRIERELIIVLKTSLVDPLRVRASRPLPRDLYRRERRDFEDRAQTARPQAEPYIQILPEPERPPARPAPRQDDGND